MPTLRQLWARGQQVLLSYEEEGAVGRHPELWPGIPYWWGNQVKAKKLIRYLERMKSCGRPGGCRPGEAGHKRALGVTGTGFESSVWCVCIGEQTCMHTHVCLCVRVDTDKHPHIIHICTHVCTGTRVPRQPGAR